jgi:glycosyltransferase 2 family protein
MKASPAATEGPDSSQLAGSTPRSSALDSGPIGWVRRHRGTVARAIAIALVIAACLHFLRGIDWRSVGVTLASASLPLLALAAALNLVQVWARALCSKVMLLPVRAIGTLRLARYNLGMYAGNNLLPGRAGELIRIHLLHSREAVAPATAVAVALVEKVFDVIGLLLVVLPLPFLFPGLPRSVSTAICALGAAGVLALVAAVVVSRYAKIDGGHFQRFASGATVVRRLDLFAAALGLTVAAWLIDAAEVAACLRSVGIETHWAAPILILLAIAGALSVPSTPANMGALELGAVAALHLLGVDETRSLAFGIAYHVIQIVPTTLLGLDGIRLAGIGAPPRS